MSHTLIPRAAAAVGIGLRLPGPAGADVRGPAQAWAHLLSGTPALGRYPQERWSAMRERLHPEDRTDRPWPVAPIALPAPGEIDKDAFGLRGSEAAQLSPTQILILEVVAEALEDAGIAPSCLAGPRTGIYVGNASPDEADTFADGARPRLADLAAGGMGMLATPVARWLDAQGPLVTLDTTCSSSLYALHDARRDLAEGRVDTAIVIGTNTAANPVVHRAFGDGTALSPTGVCRPFDAAADGYVRGEGVAVLVLRAYKQARADRDRLYGVVARTVVGGDGRSPGTGMPSTPAQAELLRQLFDHPGLDPATVDLHMGHGTATAAGDLAETKAVCEVYNRPDWDPLLLGSVKGLWGHGEGAAGLTGVIAALLSLYHRRIPPTAGHQSPHPKLDAYPLQVPVAASPWPDRGVPSPARAAVGSFGFSGALGFALLDAAPRPRSSGPAQPHTGALTLIPLAAHSGPALSASARRLALALTGQDAKRPTAGVPQLARVAAHQEHRADDGPHRAAVLAANREEARRALSALGQGSPDAALVGPVSAPGRVPGPLPAPPRSVWVFGGHGAYDAEAVRALAACDMGFADHLDRVQAALAPYRGAQGGLAALQQDTFAAQVAMAGVLQERWGQAPDAVAGHSLGAVAAAHVAGVLSLSDAARLVCARSQVLERALPAGGMVAAQVDHAAAREIAQEAGVEIACLNAPARVVFSGRHAPLARLEAALEAAQVRHRRLEGAPPAHSAAVDTHLDELASALRGLRPRSSPTGVEYLCSVSATRVDGTELGAPYWVRQLREPVEWERTVLCVASTRRTLVLEVSPQPVLEVPTAETRARHHLDLRLHTVRDRADPRAGLARAAAVAYTHRLPLERSHRRAAPLELGPLSWRPAPAASDRWAERIRPLTGPDRHRALLDLAQGAVADLAPVPVAAEDHHTHLADLGMNSMDVLTLRTSLLRGLHQPPADLPEHEPTIASIARALDTVLGP
ncbi:beta-ketoacyl synthase N-terminal-like domain-containing protein [Nocardiopsis sp. NPDC006198]|uniref:beta-ketoacyl synthase N-terminal-like domain-containing protein n=1 Tax=Nocardiopsis sp. NPDC006198 TaxID=3154472 RepID=UPI0033B5F327